MDTPSFKEDHISQIPALQLLQKLGYIYLSPAETEKLRGGKTSNVLLDDILRKQLKEINSDKRISSTKTTYISDTNIENGIRALKELPMNEGYIAACETVYDLITLGKAFEHLITRGNDYTGKCIMVIKSSKNKKPHFVSEARILRQYERSKLVTCHVLLPLGNDNTNIQDIESK